MAEDPSPDDQLSASDSESVDMQTHTNLLNAMDSMDGKKRKASQRTEAAVMSEYHVPSAKDRVMLHELMGTLSQSSSHGSLKKQIQKVKKKEKILAVPLSKPEQERIHRSLAYEKVTKEVSKWDSTVQKNRGAEQLKFPLEQPDLRMLTSPEQLIKRMKPKTSLELEVAAILKGSQNVLDSKKVLTPAEEKALQAMSVEEARERRAELQKYRALLSYKEAKARRQGKIKSKRYHRILQKEKLKKDKKAIEELERTDPDAYLDKLKRLESDRLEERISLKHRGGSKFAQKQYMYKKYDGQAREAVQEMLQKSRELTKKVVIESDSEDETGNNDGTTAQDWRTTSQESNPWMTSGIKISKRSKNESQEQDLSHNLQNDKELTTNSDSHDDEEDDKNRAKDDVNIDDLFDKLTAKKTSSVRQIKRNERHPKNMRPSESEEEAEDDSDLELMADEDEEEKVTKFTDSKMLIAKDASHSKIGLSLKRKQTLADFENSDSDDDDNDDEDVHQLREERDVVKESSSTNNGRPDSNHNADTHSSGSVSVDPNKFITIGKKSTQLQLAEDDSDEDEENEQSMTISQAFASDDVVDEFRNEKTAIQARDKPKDIDLTLPGWGDWGGENVIPSKRKKKRFTIKAPPSAPRRDRDMDNIIISEVKDRTISKHQVKGVPFPFSNPSQFEGSIRQPIGKTWNPETAYRKLIKPKIVTRLGTVISPIDKDQVFKKQKASKDTLQTREGKSGKRKKNFTNKKS